MSLKGSVSVSSTGPLDFESPGPVPDPEPTLGGLSRGSGSIKYRVIQL